MSIGLPPNYVVASSSQGLPVGPDADTFYLNATPCPGKCTLISGSAKQGWDKRKGYALMWATLVPAGEELTDLAFKVEIWEGNQYNDWLSFAANFLSRPVPSASGSSSQPSALGFFHVVASSPPYLVTSVVVEEVTALVQAKPGLFECEVHLIEWKQPIPAPPRPDQTTPATDNGPPPAADALDAQENANTETINRLAGGG